MSIIISNSKIQGKGVFANRNFKKGEIVVKWDSCLESGNQSTLMFMNHSCDPNVKEVDNYDTALRDIKKGEEITIDYEDGIPFIKLECNCGSQNCRKVLVSKLFNMKNGTD